MIESDIVRWTLIVLAAALVGLSKTGLPGVGILSVLLLAQAVGAKASVGLMLPMLIVGDIMAVTYYHRHAVWRHLFKLMPPAALGIVIGFLLLDRISNRQLQVFMGVLIVILLVLNRLTKDRVAGLADLPRIWRVAIALLTGVLAGITTMMSNAAGPIVIIYLLAMRLEKWAFIGTSAWYFLVLNCFKLPFSRDLGLISWESLKINLLMVPVIVLGALAGLMVFKRIPQKTFAVVIELLVLAAAFKLLFWP